MGKFLASFWSAFLLENKAKIERWSFIFALFKWSLLFGLIIGFLALMLGVVGRMLVIVLIVLSGVLVFLMVRLAFYFNLNQITKAADRQFSGHVCKFNQCYGVIKSIRVKRNRDNKTYILVRIVWVNDWPNPSLPYGRDFQYNEDSRRLNPPVVLGKINTRFLARHGIVIENDQLVEAKATKVSIECLRGVKWSNEKLWELKKILPPLEQTLAKAQGNELLEPSIPKLEKALRDFSREASKLRNARDSFLLKLYKIHDFLSVPADLKPIFELDVDSLLDHEDFTKLEQSFEEVVQLNDVYHNISG